MNTMIDVVSMDKSVDMIFANAMLRSFNGEQKGVNVQRNNSLKLEIMTRELRLLYYNDYLLKSGVITKREHDKMNLAIISKYGKRRRDELGEISLEERLSSVRDKR